MKLRRAIAAAAATAVISPVALLAAPAAYATEPAPAVTTAESTADGDTTDDTSNDESPSQTTTESTESTETESTDSTEQTDSTDSTDTDESNDSTGSSDSTDTDESNDSTGSSDSTDDETPDDSTDDDTSAPDSSSPEDTESPDPEPSVCEDTKVDVGISGLPGKIAAGSGWHKFSLNVLNNSDSTLQDLDVYAGASGDADGAGLFTSKQVRVQAWDPQDKVWFDLDEGGYAVGYIGSADQLEPGYQVTIPMRLQATAAAPAGAAFSLGATIYGDADDECTGFGGVSYRFQIVAAGTDTEGTKPQEGGKAPVTDKKPSGNTPQVTGSLAETGSSSALPMVGLVGGLTLVAGAGTVFVVRRRKAGTEA